MLCDLPTWKTTGYRSETSWKLREITYQCMDFIYLKKNNQVEEGQGSVCRGRSKNILVVYQNSKSFLQGNKSDVKTLCTITSATNHFHTVQYQDESTTYRFITLTLTYKTFYLTPEINIWLSGHYTDKACKKII